MIPANILGNLKIVVISILCIIAICIWKDYKYTKLELKTQADNNHQQRIYDSLRLSIYKMKPEEIKEYITYNDKDLKKKLDEANIKVSRIENLINSKYTYIDTTKYKADVSSIVDAIKVNAPKKEFWVDSTKCLITRGLVSYENGKLEVIVNKQEFKNNSNSVSYWRRKQWNFLGIKTRFLGKIEVTSKVFDECGESKTITIKKQE